MVAGSNALPFFIMVLGNTLGFHTAVIRRMKQRLLLRQVVKEEECDFIIAFVPISSRAGTDIEAALQKIPTSRPVVLVVLHHTCDADYIAPNSKHCVNREGVFTVDLLFNEEIGLLRGRRNDEALKSFTDYLISRNASPIALATYRPFPWWIWCLIAVGILMCLFVIVFPLVLHFDLGKL